MKSWSSSLPSIYLLKCHLFSKGCLEHPILYCIFPDVFMFDFPSLLYLHSIYYLTKCKIFYLLCLPLCNMHFSPSVLFSAKLMRLFLGPGVVKGLFQDCHVVCLWFDGSHLSFTSWTPQFFFSAVHVCIFQLLLCQQGTPKF